MKRIMITLGFLYCSLSAQTFQYDTLSNFNAVAGVNYYKIKESKNPWNIFVLKIDLRSENIRIETAKGQDRVVAQENPLAISRRKTYSNHRVVAATNADFYDATQGTLTTNLCNGEVVKSYETRNSAYFSGIGLDINKKPIMGRIFIKPKLILSDTTVTIHFFNKTRNLNQMICYNHYFGTVVPPDTLIGTEIEIEALSPWLANDTIPCMVKAKYSNTNGRATIPTRNYILTATGNSKPHLDRLSVGDTVRVLVATTPGIPHLDQITGGYPRIIIDGQYYEAPNAPSMLETRNPRTAVGLSRDSLYLFIIVVDGRSTASAGMTRKELADFMIGKLDIWQGTMLDGGGSACMVVNDTVRNIPSDGSLRAVANCLTVVSSTEPTQILSAIQFDKSELILFRGTQSNLNLIGYDTHGYRMGIDQSKLKFSCDSALGRFDSTTFTAGPRSAQGYIYADYEGIRDSILVRVIVINQVTLTSRFIVTDTVRSVSLKYNSWDECHTLRKLPASDYRWSLSDSSIGSIDSLGVFKGKKPGRTDIIIQIDQAADTIEAEVALIQGTSILSPMNDTTGWTITSDKVDYVRIYPAIDPATGQGNVLAIDYRMKAIAYIVQSIALYCDIPVDGVPDSISLVAWSDGYKHRLSYYYSDENGELFRNTISASQLIIKSNWEAYPLPFSSSTAVAGGLFNYPVTFKYLQIQLGYSGKIPDSTYQGTIYLKDLKVSYPGTPVEIERVNTLPSATYQLFTNYPNPFNMNTQIKYSIPEYSRVRLSIYNFLGEKVDDLVDHPQSPGTYIYNYDASGLASGIYFYQLNAATDRGNGANYTRKMVLMK
ncbi:MAG: phosphodiester glycosidase family protein [Candidatus Delongbacteria bacterium]|nr:phosphodiester glycosidase family protein [Candidatus Delongbacteria bacterium]